jgi:hypothetical protein
MRLRVERLLRGAAMLALVWAIWCGLRPAPTNAASAARVGDDPTALSALLRRWSAIDPPATIDLRVTAPPSAPTRAWLAAIAALGASVTWGAPPGDTLLATAIAVEPIADPRRAVRVGVAAPAATTVLLRDALGPLDSARAERGFVTFRAGGPLVAPEGIVGRHARDVTHALATPGDSLILRPVLVIATAGWEGAFVARALAALGWRVDARFTVAPHADVITSPPAALDTAHYAAVVLLDTVPGLGDAIRRYVQSGGGLVVAAAAQRASGVGVLATTGTRPAAASLADSAPRRGLALTPIDTLDAALIVLERRGDLPSVVARRIGSGREIVEGYGETWRWRMAAGDDGPRAHAEWWGGLVSAAAYAPSIPRPSAARVDRAPLAATVAQLGPPTPLVRIPDAGGGSARPWWLFATIGLALSAEWASRRLRGAA